MSRHAGILIAFPEPCVAANISAPWHVSYSQFFARDVMTKLLPIEGKVGLHRHLECICGSNMNINRQYIDPLEEDMAWRTGTKFAGWVPIRFREHGSCDPTALATRMSFDSFSVAFVSKEALQMKSCRTHDGMPEGGWAYSFKLEPDVFDYPLKVGSAMLGNGIRKFARSALPALIIRSLPDHLRNHFMDAIFRAQNLLDRWERVLNGQWPDGHPLTWIDAPLDEL
jgi:hypothetical protein